jgi:hypothetical protein
VYFAPCKNRKIGQRKFVEISEFSSRESDCDDDGDLWAFLWSLNAENTR